MKLNKNIKIFFNYFLGPLLFIYLSVSIYRQINRQPDLEHAWQQLKISFLGTGASSLSFIIILMLGNWGIEAMKWKLAIEKIQPISFIKSLKAIFSGVSFSVTTPNRVGEYFGRVLYMKEGNRLKAISLTIVCSISQLLVTLWMGLFGLLVLKSQKQDHYEFLYFPLVTAFNQRCGHYLCFINIILFQAFMDGKMD